MKNTVKARPAVNRHGLKMEGLKAASGATKYAVPWRSWVQVDYCMDTGEVLTAYHVNQSDYAVWRLPNVAHILTTSKRMSMQQIADAIRDAVDLYRSVCPY